MSDHGSFGDARLKIARRWTLPLRTLLPWVAPGPPQRFCLTHQVWHFAGADHPEDRSLNCRSDD